MAPHLPGDPRLRLRITRPERCGPSWPRSTTRCWRSARVSSPAAMRGGTGSSMIPRPTARTASPLRCVLAEDDAGPRGYALYSGVGRWDDDRFLPDAQLDIRELVAADPAASAALWADLLSRDLVTTIRAAIRPVDDPLLFQLADPRRLRPVVTDGLWARITDLPAALTLRRYASPVDVIIEVQDDLFPAQRRADGICKRTSPGRLSATRSTRPRTRLPVPRDHRARRRLLRRDAAGSAGGRGAGDPAAHRRAGPAVRRHVLGSGAVVPSHLLSWHLISRHLDGTRTGNRPPEPLGPCDTGHHARHEGDAQRGDAGAGCVAADRRGPGGSRGGRAARASMPARPGRGRTEPGPATARMTPHGRRPSAARMRPTA